MGLIPFIYSIDMSNLRLFCPPHIGRTNGRDGVAGGLVEGVRFEVCKPACHFCLSPVGGSFFSRRRS